MNTIADFLGKDQLNGQLFGVEIETEGHGLDGFYTPIGWSATRDGSLRGEGAKEFVTRRPHPLPVVLKLVSQLYSDFKEQGVTINDSVRAGVHVHINILDLTPNQLANLIVLSMIFEGLLSLYCGEQRVGNLFCLRSIDAQAVKNRIIYGLTHKDFHQFNDDDYRYGFINIKSVVVHGSLEFRSMRTTTGPKEILDWIKLLNCLREACVKYNNPKEIVEGMSGIGPLEFKKQVFGGLHKLLKFQNEEDIVIDCVRNAQDIVYAIDWDGKPNKKNPFGASKSKARVGRVVARAVDKFCYDAPDPVGFAVRL